MKSTKFSAMLFAILSSFFMACEQGGYDPDEPGLLVAKTVEDDASLPAIAVNGTLLHSEAFGDPKDPMLVTVHGGPGADYRYMLNCKAFAEQGYYVVFYDQRGSGLSKRHPKNSYSLEVMYDDLTAVIAHYRTSPDQKVFLFGHSWGAILASAYINAGNTNIDGLILAEPGGLIWQDIVDYVGRTRNFGFFSETLNNSTYLDQFISGKENDHEVWDYKLNVLASADGAKDSPIGNEGPVPFWRSGAVVNGALFELGRREKPDWTPNLKQYKTKILFVYSENNTAYGEAYARKVSSAYPNVQLEITLDAGHDMITFPTGWQNFYPVALKYLNSLK